MYKFKYVCKIIIADVNAAIIIFLGVWNLCI